MPLERTVRSEAAMSDFGTTAAMFARSTAIFSRTINGIPAEKWLVQPSADSNHLLWIAGHVVVHRGLTARLLGAEWSAPWEKLFARGTKRVAADQYPPATDIEGAWEEVSEKLTTALAKANPQTLGHPALQGMPSLDGTAGGTVSFLCLHEIYHVGQMGYLRKWLGYGQVVG
jgi:hypothetical protein